MEVCNFAAAAALHLLKYANHPHEFVESESATGHSSTTPRHHCFRGSTALEVVSSLMTNGGVNRARVALQRFPVSSQDRRTAAPSITRWCRSAFWPTTLFFNHACHENICVNSSCTARCDPTQTNLLPFVKMLVQRWLKF